MIEFVANGRVYWLVQGVIYFSREAALAAREGSK